MTSEIKQSAPVVITAIIAIAAIEIYALSLGINGVLLTGVIAVIAAIVGVKAGAVFEKGHIARCKKEEQPEKPKEQ